MEENKKAFIIQGIHSFVSGVLTILLPFLMLEREIDIISIGLIYSILPIIFQLTRLGFAVLSDFIGRKIFFVLNGISRILHTIIYYFAFSPLEFIFGKIAEGMSEASLWAVNRAFVLEHTKKKWESLVEMRVFESVSEAFGILVAGFLMSILLYSNTLIFCMFISLLSLFPSLKIHEAKKKKLKIEKFFQVLKINKRGKFFKSALILFFILGLSLGLVAYYVFPLFLKENGYSSEAVGIIVGVQTLIAGISLHYFIKIFSFKRIILYGAIIYFILIISLSISNFLAGLILILLGFGYGFVVAGIEAIFSKSTNHFAYGTDIGLLMTTFHLARTLSLAISGFIISLYGFSILFTTSGLLFLLYSFLSLKWFRE